MGNNNKNNKMYDNNEGLHRNIIHGIILKWVNSVNLFWAIFEIFVRLLMGFHCFQWFFFLHVLFNKEPFLELYDFQVIWMSHLKKICYEHIMKCNQLKIHIRKFAQNSCKMNGLQGIQLYRVFRYNATSLGVMLDTVICSRK